MGHKGHKGQPNRDGSFGAHEGCYMGPTMTEGFFWWIIVQNDFFRGTVNSAFNKLDYNGIQRNGCLVPS